MTLPVGVAVCDITPPTGLPLAGFAARTDPAIGAQDGLSVRVLAVADTALVVADVIGVDAASSKRIAAASGLPAERVVVAATHTHGGPGTMPGRLATSVDGAYLARFETAAARAVREAVERQQPCHLYAGTGRLEGVAFNRRDAQGPVDVSVPVLEVRSLSSDVVAVLTSFACHPVVLGADNLRWTADYPGLVRRAIEAKHPGAVAIYATGCAGDVNTGHSARQSKSLRPDSNRTFEAASRVGLAVASAALSAEMRPVGGDVVSARFATCQTAFEPVDADEIIALERLWREERAEAAPGERAVLDMWIEWSHRIASRPPEVLGLTAGALRWGDVVIACLPGEIFAGTGLEVRATLPEALFVLGYCGDNPGYLPPQDEYRRGGYEVAEAHRFYGFPAAFAPGSAEQMRDQAIECSRQLLGRPS